MVGRVARWSRNQWREARHWLLLVRNGLNATSALRLRAGRTDDLRFQGRALACTNPELAARQLLAIFGGEYAPEGFVPRRGDVVVDIGANIGVYSLYAAHKGAQVVAYEPHPETFALLKANTTGRNVECHQAAVVGKGTDPVALWINPDRDTRHTLFGTEIIKGTKLTKSINVPAVPIDDVLKNGCDNSPPHILHRIQFPNYAEI